MTLIRKKPSSSSSPNINQETLISLKEWNWKLEQSISQLQGRINAVENRLSQGSANSSESLNGVHDHHELSNLSDTSYNLTVQSLIDQYQETLTSLQDSHQALHKTVDHLVKKQKSSSFVMQFKGKEIPLEITGIIGGILTLLIAFLIGMGGTTVVLSPIFLTSIGLILIGATLFRSFKGIDLIRTGFHQRGKSKSDVKNK